MQSVRSVRNLCVLQALCNIKPKLVRSPEGVWDMLVIYIYNSYLLTLPPIATPLEFSHQFYNCFDPKYRSFLKRSLCPSQVRAGYLSCPSKFFQSFVAIESIYLVYAQAHAERLLLCSTHALKSQCKSSLISICGKVTMTAFENELGVQAPVGFWDPAGLSSLRTSTDVGR